MDKSAIIDFFDGLADRWDSWQEDNNHQISLALDLIEPDNNLKILDVACGTGILEPFFEKYCPSRMLCVDISSEMIALARKKRRNSWVEYLHSDIFDINECDFDLCIVHNALPHFENFENLLSNLSQRLKNGGRIMVLHSESRESINRRHMDKAMTVSRYLPPADDFVKTFNVTFNADIMVDTKKMYLVSGIKAVKM